MARKNATPVLTHTEILCLAIRAIDADIGRWRERCEGLPEDVFERSVADLLAKRSALKDLYHVETGTEYD